MNLAASDVAFFCGSPGPTAATPSILAFFNATPSILTFFNATTCQLRVFDSCFFLLSIVIVKIGSGTYSNVYKAIDLDKRHVVALKKVRIDGVAAVGPGEPQKNATSEAARFMVREIQGFKPLGLYADSSR
ncbi:serine/threonine-protein kinase [Carex littledalei]|uniref:Serine/threonine-protein kinase n=1 Tax=Carex littledalei TaxID=544730 RepID=A0A833QGZ2_9POAL|nr:serine/threonine-protein kinase [Carex littledalei]